MAGRVSHDRIPEEMNRFATPGSNEQGTGGPESPEQNPRQYEANTKIVGNRGYQRTDNGQHKQVSEPVLKSLSRAAATLLQFRR
mgnify:CR=1 FL=1